MKAGNTSYYDMTRSARLFGYMQQQLEKLMGDWTTGQGT